MPGPAWQLLKQLNVPVLPNTAGCMSLQEAITTAQMAREVFDTPWIKLELIGDDYTLQPDTLNLVQAADILIKDGFKVLPYCTEDLVLCQRLVDVGCQAVMPWAAPIGTGRGPANPYAMQMLRERLDVPLIVDAGLGRPSHACTVMEWGFDGVLLNTAVALAQDPVAMAGAFADATQAGRNAYRAGAMAEQTAAQVMEWGFDGVLLNTAVALSQDPVAMAGAFADAVAAGRAARRAGAMEQHASAQPSTPVLGTPFWHHEELKAGA